MDISPRLSAIVDRSLKYRITEIVAPAGFGKTTLLNELMARRGFLLASIRPGDNAPLALMRALCQAVSRDLPDLLQALPDAFNNAPSTKSDLSSWFVRSVEGCRYRIAVDDLHHLDDDDDAMALLGSIVEASSSGGSQWILTSRTWPKLPTVAWTAKGDEGAPICEDDLLLSADDLVHFSESIGAKLCGEEAARMLRATKGWPLLSVYAVRLVQQGQTIERALEAVRGRGIGAVADQMLSKLTVEQRRLLLAIGLLDGALPEELEITQLDGSKNAYQLTLAGVPLSQGDDGKWRLHDALRQHLLAGKSVRGIDDAEGIASQFEAKGKLDAALRIVVAASAENKVRELLEHHASHFVDGSDPHLLRGALATLPHHTVHSSPQLLLARGTEELIRGDASLAVEYFRRAVDLSDDDFKAFAKTRLLQGLVDLDGHAEEARAAASDIAELPIPLHADDACDVLSYLGQSLSILGENDRAKQLMRAALSLVPRLSNPRIETRVYLRASRVALDASMIEEAGLFADRAIVLGERFGLFNALFLAFRLRMMAVAPTDEAKAIECARICLKYANQILNKRYAYFAESSLLTFACRAGQLQEAKELRRRLIPVPNELRTRVGGVVLIVSAQLALLEGDYWEAARLLAEVRSFGDSALEADLIGPREVVFNALTAFLHLFTGLPEDAVKAARTTLNLASQVDLEGRASAAAPEIEISQIMAAAILGVNEGLLEAEAILDDLVQTAHEAYRRDLACWARMALMDRAAEPSAAALRFAKGIVELIRRAFTAAQQDSLTSTERRVLESLALGRSNKEIAAFTGKSVKTVDNQVSSILRKLQARSRGEAVARARSSGALRA